MYTTTYHGMLPSVLDVKSIAKMSFDSEMKNDAEVIRLVVLSNEGTHIRAIWQSIQVIM